jgi:hypothetical protein
MADAEPTKPGGMAATQPGWRCCCGFDGIGATQRLPLLSSSAEARPRKVDEDAPCRRRGQRPLPRVRTGTKDGQQRPSFGLRDNDTARLRQPRTNPKRATHGTRCTSTHPRSTRAEAFPDNFAGRGLLSIQEVTCVPFQHQRRNEALAPPSSVRPPYSHELEAPLPVDSHEQLEAPWTPWTRWVRGETGRTEPDDNIDYAPHRVDN